MTKHFYILLIVILGFFLTPTLTYAFGSKFEKTEKTCYTTEASQSYTKDCCKKSHPHKDKTNDGYNGKCKDSLCHCPSINFNIVISVVPEMIFKNHFVAKQNLFNTKSYISSGFYSIWLLPKIS